ncbi:MAG: efflux RND transporter periplasmic adaptor subunit [Rikenellaceae bacterium]
MKITNTILVALPIILYSSCSSNHKQEQMPPLRVEVSKATRTPISDQITTATQIESLYHVIIQPRVDGFLESINYDEGMPVKKGDLLFRIEPGSFATALYSAKADLESALARELAAKNDFDRALPLSKINAISQSDLDQYTATYRAAKAASEVARQNIESAQLNIDYTQIYAPIAGLIAKTNANQGDYVGPSTKLSDLTTISYTDTIMVNIAIPTSKYLSHIPDHEQGTYDNRNLLSNIRLTLADSTIYPHQGEYHYTKKNTPKNSSTIVIVAKFPNPQLRLKEGMFAKVTANIGEEQEKILVPQSAISQVQGVNSLWMVTPDSTARFQKVTLGETQGDQWIIEQGIEPNQMVISSGAIKMHNGAKVIPEVKP